MKTKTTHNLAFAFLAGGLLLLGSGCSSPKLVRVHPWERATLADAIMDPGRDPLARAASEHVYFSRESASGGRTVNGSGCGCN